MNTANIFARTRLAALLMGGVSAAALAAVPALAQSTDDSLETVVVTGTLLKGIAPVGTNVVGFSATDIKATGALNPANVLANIPQITNLFANSVYNDQSGGKSTYTAPAIRNLDNAGKSTLVLVNGLSLVGNGGLQNTNDGSSVPAIALQRVDVVLDGGSALYGSNAVAGIINFITRTSYEGLEGRVTYGTTGNYDAFQASVIGGHAWASGSAFLAYEYRNNSMQFQADRPYGRQNLVPLGGTLDQRSTTCATPNITAGGVAYTITGNVTTAPGSLKAAVTPGTTKCDTALDSTAIPGNTQSTLWGQFNQHLGDGIEFSMSANWARAQTVGLSSQLGTTNGTITNANPYFQSINGETKQTVSFTYAPSAGRYSGTVTKQEQFGVTPKVSFELWGDWSGDVTASYQRSFNNKTPRNVNTVGYTNALVSPDRNFALDPYNILLSQPAVVQNIIQYTQIFQSTQQLEMVRGQANGTLFELPGGPLKAAIGAEYKYMDYRGYDVTGPIGQDTPPAVDGGLYIRSNAHRTIAAAFGELLVPVVGPQNNIPFIHSLNIDLAARFDSYNDVGNTTNPKFGVSYEPIEGLTIRGNAGDSFVAPNLGDTGAAVDTRVNVSTSSSIRAPLSVSGRSAAQDAIDANRPTIGIAGGSNGLVPQKAHTYSFGFDYHPDFVPGLELGLTKWHVSFYKLIGIIPYTVANLLYGIPAYQPYYVLFPTLAQLNAITAGIPQQGFNGYDYLYASGPNNEPYQIRDLRRHNLGNQFNGGLDFHVAYTTDTNLGVLSMGLDGTDFTEFKLQGYTGGPITDQMPANTSPYQLTANVGLTSGPFSSKLTYNYVASYSITGVVGQNHISSFQLVNAMISYDLDGTWDAFSGATASLNINNLFDTNPPFVNSGNGTVIAPVLENTLGRYFQFTLTKKF